MKIIRIQIISVIVLSSFISLGCPKPRFVKDPITRTDIPLPECRDYVGKFGKVGLNLNILDKYKAAFDISAEYKSSLENIQQHYTLQARDLCSKAGTYIAAGKKDEWFCREERLGNSAMQLEAINRVLEGIKNIEDAQNESARIKDIIDDYFIRFFKQFDKPCYFPPVPRLLEAEQPDFYFTGDEKIMIRDQRGNLRLYPCLIHKGHAVERRLTFIWVQRQLYSIDRIIGRMIKGKAPSNQLWMAIISTSEVKDGPGIDIFDASSGDLLPLRKQVFQQMVHYAINVGEEFNVMEASSYGKGTQCEKGDIEADHIFLINRFVDGKKYIVEFVYDKRPAFVRLYSVTENMIPIRLEGMEKPLRKEELGNLRKEIMVLKTRDKLVGLDGEQITGGVTFSIPLNELYDQFDLRHSCY